MEPPHPAYSPNATGIPIQPQNVNINMSPTQPQQPNQPNYPIVSVPQPINNYPPNVVNNNVQQYQYGEVAPQQIQYKPSIQVIQPIQQQQAFSSNVQGVPIQYNPNMPPPQYSQQPQLQQIQVIQQQSLKNVRNAVIAVIIIIDIANAAMIYVV